MAIKSYQIREFTPVSSLQETTRLQGAQTKLQNAVLRPIGGFKGTLNYDRLLQIPTFSSLKNALYGSTPVATLKTTAVQISSQGKNWLYFYDWVNERCRGGPFYMGDDGSFVGTLNLITGTPTYTSLATGLDTNARWYDYRHLDCIYLGNGVDPNMIAQLGRSAPALPHPRLRIAGSDQKPATPIIRTIPVTPVTQVQAKLSVTGRTGGVDLVFEANAEQFGGIKGDNINIAIIHDTYGAGEVTLSRTGVGSSASPFYFTIITTSTHSSNFDISSVFNSHPLTFGIVSVISGMSNTTPDFNAYGTESLIGGVDASDSEGFIGTTKSVFLRYFDAGNNGFGYESPSSDQSAIVFIPSGAGNERDIEVRITGNPSVEGGRFGFIRVYLQFGDDDVTFNLVATVQNIAGDQIVKLGTNITIGQPLVVDQSRPPATKYFTHCGQKTWMSGNSLYSSQIWISKFANDDELAPEGCASSSYIVVQGGDEAGRAQITALASDEQYTYAHTRSGITAISPQEYNRYNSPVTAGAFNQNMLANWERSKSYFLARNLLFYEFNGARYGKKDSDFKSLDAAAYMRDIIDRNAVNANPDRAWLMPDINGQMLWMWLPAMDGTLKGFAYDMILQGVVGEFDHPKIYHSSKLEIEYNESVASDEYGNLFVINSANQFDHGDILPVTTTFTPRPLDYVPPASENGWGTVIYDAAKYTQAVDVRVRTGMIDLGNLAMKKKFMGVVFTTVQNSRGIVEVTFYGEGGKTITRRYGEIGTYPDVRNKHKLIMMMSDYAVRVEFRVISAEKKPFIIRDIELLYEDQGRK